MIYPYMTLNDNTEITHSKMSSEGEVKVYIEKPNDNGGFDNATCILPRYEWIEVNGYTKEDIAKWQKFLENNAHLILEFAQTGGILNDAADI